MIRAEALVFLSGIGVNLSKGRKTAMIVIAESTSRNDASENNASLSPAQDTAGRFEPRYDLAQLVARSRELKAMSKAAEEMFRQAEQRFMVAQQTAVNAIVALNLANKRIIGH